MLQTRKRNLYTDIKLISASDRLNASCVNLPLYTSHSIVKLIDHYLRLPVCGGKNCKTSGW